MSPGQIPPSARMRIAQAQARKISGTFKERNHMTRKSKLYLGAAAIAAALAGSAGGPAPQQTPPAAIDDGDIRGVVTRASRPEARGPVSADNPHPPTPSAPIVVTHHHRRHPVP